MSDVKRHTYHTMFPFMPLPGMYAAVEYVLASDYDALAQQLAQACKERDEAKADAKTGWDAFRKLRQSVAEDRYPGMTGKINGSDKK